MLKVKLELDPQFTDRGEMLVREADRFRGEGIEIGVDVSDPDVTILHESLYHLQEGDNTRFDPLIIFERQASATLGVNGPTRRAIERTNVVGWMKEHTLRDPALHNLPTYMGRYHYGLMAPEIPVSDYKAPPQISATALNKIGVAAPHYLNPLFDAPRAMKCGSLPNRRIEVMYSGTVRYAFDPLQNHRISCCHIIQDLPARHKVIGVGRVFQKRFFDEALRDTRIFVSPYGWGEYSWKDYEAIYAGCVLVKPTSNFVTTAGFDIFAPGKYCVECAPDFSDLAEVTTRILEDPTGSAAFARAAREALMAATKGENWVPASAAWIKAKAGS